jgi:hypothetical protein
MATLPALEGTGFFDQAVVAAIDANGLSIDQGIGHDLPRPLNNPSESGTRNPHETPRILMGQIQEIRKPQCLVLVNREADFLQVHHGDTSRLKITDIRPE